MRAAAVLVLALAACKTPGGELEKPPASVKVLETTAVIKQGAIGVQDRQDATYVLVQGENGSDVARMVALEGELLDAGGKSLGKLFIDELRVPPGERRTFALVGTQAYPGAASAKLRVRSAPPAKDDPVAVVTELVSERTPRGLMATATVENKMERQAIATVIVTFFDADGKILSRPFAPVALLPRSTRQFSFDGPVEAVKAEAFVGDAAY